MKIAEIFDYIVVPAAVVLIVVALYGLVCLIRG